MRGEELHNYRPAYVRAILLADVSGKSAGADWLRELRQNASIDPNSASTSPTSRESRQCARPVLSRLHIASDGFKIDPLLPAGRPPTHPPDFQATMPPLLGWIAAAERVSVRGTFPDYRSIVADNGL